MLSLGDRWDGQQFFMCSLPAGHKGKHKSSDEQYGGTVGHEYTEKWEIKWWREKGQTS